MLLMDSNGRKEHLTHGNTLHDSDIIPHSLLARLKSEPPPSCPELFFSGFLRHTSKDDAYNLAEFKGYRNNQVRAAGLNPVQVPRFNARQLLDPKGFRTSKRESSLGRTAPETGLTHESSESDAGNLRSKRLFSGDDGQGMGGLIERVHNVTSREATPRKKQKVAEAEDGQAGKPKAVFSGGGKGGDIGQYLQEKQKEGQDLAICPKAVVDLTKG